MIFEATVIIEKNNIQVVYSEEKHMLMVGRECVLPDGIRGVNIWHKKDPLTGIWYETVQPRLETADHEYQVLFDKAVEAFGSMRRKLPLMIWDREYDLGRIEKIEKNSKNELTFHVR